MDDDFNTPQAFAVMFDAVTAIHEARRSEPADMERLSAAVGVARASCATFFFVRARRASKWGAGIERRVDGWI